MEKRGMNVPFLVSGVILVILGAGFLVYYLQSSGTIASHETNIANLKSQVATLQAQLSLANTQGASLQDQLTAANGQITTLKGQVTTATGQISSLQTQLTSAKNDTTSAQNQLTASNTQATSLQSQLAQATTQVTSLQAQVTSDTTQISSLQSQVNSLTQQIQAYQLSGGGTSTGTSSSTIASSVNISQAPGQQSLIISFTAGSAGTLTVTGFTSTFTGYVRMVNNTFSVATNHPFTSGGSLTIPVQSGAIQLYFGNADTTGSITATISSVVFAH